MKGWLCMNPVDIKVFGYRTEHQPGILAMLAVYRTKKAAQKVSGKNAALLEVSIPGKDDKC